MKGWDEARHHRLAVVGLALLLVASIGSVLYVSSFGADKVEMSLAGTGCGGTTYFRDADGDGYGYAPGGTTCSPTAGYVDNNLDCNDNQTAIHPGANEVCDAGNTDEDCDAQADDADTGGAQGKSSWYADADADSYGGGTPQDRCDPGGGYTSPTLSDCNDEASSINPGATEVCDAGNTDEDCDGLSDDADSFATDKTVYYPDADGDGYGDPNASEGYCDFPGSPYVDNGGDCDDTDAGLTTDCDFPDLLPGPSPDLWFKCITRNGHKVCKVRELQLSNVGAANLPSNQHVVVQVYRSAADRTAGKLWGKKTVDLPIAVGQTVTLTIKVGKGSRPIAPVAVVDASDVVQELDEDNNELALSFA